jgi:uncharacterized protein
MQLFVAQISEEGSSVEQEISKEWLEGVLLGIETTDFRPTGDLQASLRAQRTGGDVLVSSDLAIRLGCECALCLTGFEMEVPVRFSLTYKPKPVRPVDMPEDLELTHEDLEECYYEGDSIDLEEVLREQIILALPMYPRCSETCRGLCPVCGVNKNQQSCSCERDEADPRWAKLRTLTRR